MEKAVLISIRPEWCEKIARGVKTIEVRKTRPKIEAPFRCYIYCTMPNTKDPHQVLEIHGVDGKIRKANGQVIGEFVCDEIIESRGIHGDKLFHALLGDTGLTYEEGMLYGKGKEIFGWHISDLFIYDKPKELGEFRIPRTKEYKKWTDPKVVAAVSYHCMGEYPAMCACNGSTRITRAPQSWCYVEPVT